jgi:hypothetical protein
MSYAECSWFAAEDGLLILVENRKAWAAVAAHNVEVNRGCADGLETWQSFTRGSSRTSLDGIASPEC